MTFYALVDQNKLFVPAHGKIIPQEEFSCLLSGEGLLATLEQEKQRLLEEHTQLIEQLHKSGEDKGFAEGLKKWNEQVIYLENSMHAFREQIGKTLSSLALVAVKKIVGKEVEAHPEIIVDIVKTALKAVSQHRKIKIFVNKQDFDLLENQRPAIKEVLENLETLAIEIRDDVIQGGCIIATEAGIINAQLDQQLNALEGAFQDFFKNWSASEEA